MPEGLRITERHEDPYAWALAQAARLRQEGGFTEADELLPLLRYLAPEALQGQGVDARSDVFSVGALLHELLTGAPAFPGDDAVSVANDSDFGLGASVWSADPRVIAGLARAVSGKVSAGESAVALVKAR